MSKDQSPESAATLELLCSQAHPGIQVIALVVGVEPLRLMHASDSRQYVYPAGWCGLLAFRPGVRVLAGDARLVPLAKAGLVKLQAFVDQALTPSAERVDQPLASLPAPLASLAGEKPLANWYVAQTLSDPNSLATFAELLRQGESYRLVCFLLAQSAASEKLSSLARKYGVSVSHFRRLCHEALGGAAKPEMREWRSAQALLAMARGKRSLTDVALEFGFASSSHFSKEIRELVGVKPSSLIDITRLSSK
jgi:AraC-like DNA-binding protein